MTRWIAALLEYEPTALDSLRDYLVVREEAASANLMGAEGAELYRAQGAFAELQILRAALKNALTETQHPRDKDLTV